MKILRITKKNARGYFDKHHENGCTMGPSCPICQPLSLMICHLYLSSCSSSIMSFGGEASGSDVGVLANFKSFVSEEQLEEKRRVRQEEWEKVRKAEDPIGKDSI